jgi:hypothetical protein
MRYLIATITVLSLLFIAPSAALAVECPSGEVEANGTAANDWPSAGNAGRCVPFSEWLGEREAAQQAHEAQERAEASEREQKEAVATHARQAEEKKETGGPPTKLHVTVVSAHGSTYRAPGHSVLHVETNQFAEVFFKFTYPQHPTWRPDIFSFKERLGKETNPAAGENNAVDDPWSCRAPMLVEDWEVQVKGENNGVLESAPALLDKGQIVDDVSSKWCKAAKKRSRAARRRH